MSRKKKLSQHEERWRTPPWQWPTCDCSDGPNDEDRAYFSDTEARPSKLARPTARRGFSDTTAIFRPKVIEDSTFEILPTPPLTSDTVNDEELGLTGDPDVGLQILQKPRLGASLAPWQLSTFVLLVIAVAEAVWIGLGSMRSVEGPISGRCISPTGGVDVKSGPRNSPTSFILFGDDQSSCRSHRRIRRSPSGSGLKNGTELRRQDRLDAIRLQQCQQRFTPLRLLADGEDHIE